MPSIYSKQMQDRAREVSFARLHYQSVCGSHCWQPPRSSWEPPASYFHN